MDILPFYLWFERAWTAGFWNLKLRTKLFNLSIKIHQRNHFFSRNLYPVFLEFCSDLQAWLLSEWMHNYKDCLIEDKKFKKIGTKLYALKYFGLHFFSNFESFLKKRWRLTFERQPECRNINKISWPRALKSKQTEF